MKVGLLTFEQKNYLIGREYNASCFYNPIQDINGNWIISIEEMNMSDIDWVQNIPLIDFISSES